MTHDTVIEIKKALRAAMNGVLSAKMREAGMPYKLVFGVELPRLLEISKEFAPDLKLALELWNENIRECKILAVLLLPDGEMTADLAEIWVSEIPTAEIAQILVMYQLRNLPQAADVAFRWIASEDDTKQLCGYLTIAHLLQRGAELNERSVKEITDQATAGLEQADFHLRKAIYAVLSRLPAQTSDNSGMIMES